MGKDFGLREQKAVLLKLKLLEITVDLIQEKKFSKMYVDDICTVAQISKVTFFKYFPQKEDLLVYFMRVWVFKYTTRLPSNKPKGKEGIKHLFNALASDHKKQPGIMLALISFICDLDKPPAFVELSDLEKITLFPEIEGVHLQPTQTLSVILNQHIQESIDKKEFNQKSKRAGLNRTRFLETLITILYGVPLMSHITNNHDIHKIYNKQIENAYIAFSHKGELS